MKKQNKKQSSQKGYTSLNPFSFIHMRIVASMTFVHQLSLNQIKVESSFHFIRIFLSDFALGPDVTCLKPGQCFVLGCHVENVELTLFMNHVPPCCCNQACMWKRLDDSCWFLTDIKGTSSVLYDVNKKHQVSLIRKKDCDCYCV